ncbi:hypothetical protein BDZ85DRAFT_255793 [Elsinoe ampelina]|uniref:RING-CH-type domain-containing protein n=1 Tax=Elsinoe ampelina TaxID=302913 RepID=A0A6A6GKQ1_9PEZI|nr:hypothetical protein BDZ85DRAFT_255793 [Elsinoe ampelina]
MASMPPQQPSQRRTSPEQSSSSSSQAQDTNSRSRSAVSDDSQMVMLSTPSPGEAQADGIAAVARPTPKRQDTDLKKCWICFADESEDTPETSQWRSPCPCALVAHEECLLDWIADMESPLRKRSIAAPQILCPQCKTEIHLARPWNPLVEAVKAFERVSAKMITPSAVVVGFETIRQAFVAHGMYTIVAVFGTDDARWILRPFLSSRLYEIWDFEARAQELRDHWRLHLGLPLITPMLILSRTSLADSVLPVLPIVFFATQGDVVADAFSEPTYWPPSASLTFAVLPYLRGAYNAYYQRVWSAHEKRWLKDIQPRNQDPQDGGGNGEANEQNDEVAAEEEGVFEIRVDGDIWEDWNGNDGNEAPIPPPNPQEADNRAAIDAMINAADNADNPNAEQEEAHPLNAPPLDADAGPDARLDEPPEHVDIPRNPPAAPQQQPAAPAPALQNAERRLSFSTTLLAENVIGALLFPTIASLSGELLRLCLPTSWTSPVLARTWKMGLGRTKTTGLLQEKWGRSVVGGCLFVVVKDAVMLYVRWKMAQQHRRRRVLDYDRRKGRATARGTA